MDVDQIMEYLEQQAQAMYAASAPFLSYHTWDHIKQARTALRSLQDWAIDFPDAQQRAAEDVAVLFHDAVYVPGSSTNEEASARLLLKTSQALAMSTRSAPMTAAAIRLLRLVTATAPQMINSTTFVTHLREGDHGPAINRVLDADISTLACDWPVFAEAQLNVVRESHVDFDGMAPKAQVMARAKAVSGFHVKMLMKKRIFRSPGTGEWEDRARANLRRYISRWEEV